MSTSRLRKTFRFPAEDDSDDPSDLDEEHQERLIATLSTRDAQSTEKYRLAFLTIPGISLLPFLYILLSPSSTARTRLLSILAISSLGCTAYILHFQPLEKPDRRGKTPVYKLEAAKGPADKYLMYLNAALAWLLGLASLVSWKREEYEDAWREAVPMLVFGVIMIVRQQLAPVDLEELEKARYELKGA